MKSLSVAVIARNFRRVLDALERDREEVMIVRKRRPVARLVPEPRRQDALGFFGDLDRTLDQRTGSAVASSLASLRKCRRGRITELRNPWAR
jgi:antitoxin (DNA-binding transcriptional repressor) of toxin-antitoxin stability system